MPESEMRIYERRTEGRVWRLLWKRVALERIFMGWKCVDGSCGNGGAETAPKCR